MRAFIYDAIRRRTSPSLRQSVRSNKWVMSIISRLFDSDIYSQSYYEQVEDAERASVEIIGKWIRTSLNPTNVVDVGCGPGHLIEALANEGVDVLGIDYSAAARENVARKGLPFQTFDLTSPGKVIPGSPWDLAVCCEVAEHLDARHADVFVKNLSSASSTIFLTAAEVGQGGLNHVNEQPNSYWTQKLANCGFAFDEKLSAQARATFAGLGVVHYLAKPMLFRRIQAAKRR
jgi:SAM-dependent methyltransferase